MCEEAELIRGRESTGPGCGNVKRDLLAKDGKGYLSCMSGFDSWHTRFAILRNSVSDWVLASQAFRHGSVALIEVLNKTTACRYISYLDSHSLEHFILFQPPVPVLLLRTLKHRNLLESVPCRPGSARCPVPTLGIGGNACKRPRNI